MKTIEISGVWHIPSMLSVSEAKVLWGRGNELPAVFIPGLTALLQVAASVKIVGVLIVV